MNPTLVRGMLLTVLALPLAGCHWKSSNARYHTPSGHYADAAARSAFVDRRVDELAAQGLSREAAAARASREWFASAPVATEVPTAYELKRREAQSEFEEELRDQRSAKRP